MNLPHCPVCDRLMTGLFPACSPPCRHQLGRLCHHDYAKRSSIPPSLRRKGRRGGGYPLPPGTK